ncbi:MAG: stage II sporulation protein M [Desulfosalsimonas sp.]
MRQEHFEAVNTPLWQRYDEIAAEIKKRSSNRGPFNAAGFPALYRKICNHYALALSRQYSPALVTRLHERVLLGHQIIYQQTVFHPFKIINFFSFIFPSIFRNNIAYFGASLLLFLIPLIGTGLASYFQHDFIYSIMDTSRVAEMEFMYDPANKEYARPADKQQDTSIAMFGYYIRNNISIGFRTFAGGILAGTGTVFFLAINGIFLGAVTGHITRLGFTSTFWPFVSGHGAFELTAIVISGAAGLILAKAVIAPGNRYRSDALRRNALTALQLILGAAAMLVLAAFIEAFWSAAATPIAVKYLVAGLLWGLVIAYLGFAGKGR